MNSEDQEKEIERLAKTILFKEYITNDRSDYDETVWSYFRDHYVNVYKQIVAWLKDPYFKRSLRHEEIEKVQKEVENMIKQSLTASYPKKAISSGDVQDSITDRAVNRETSQIKQQAQQDLWRYQTSPEHEPDPHSEWDCKALKSSDGLNLIGASVRGKKHKHEGSNRDDWFELATSGVWTIIAVSDGAGSKMFSRVGAKAACEGAVKYLVGVLEDYKIKERDVWSPDTFRRDEATGTFAEEDLECLQEALHKAMQAAYQTVEEAWRDRDPLKAHYKSLNNRDLTIKDLSATLLLALHTTISYKNQEYSLVFSCHIGDGMIAAVDDKGAVQLLAQPDSGEYAGQTEFLTSPSQLTKDNLMRKTFPFFSPLKALMVMTDGVADDYFPYEQKMLDLYGDLLFNRVINFPLPTLGEIVDQLSNSPLGTLAGVEEAKNKFQYAVKRLTSPEDTIQTVSVLSITNYAQEFQMNVSQILKNTALLAAGCKNHLLWENSQNEPPEERLKIWLDSYQVKGSYDDRTLVVLYREVTHE